MSGKRIFEEIKTLKIRQGKLQANLGHIDFIDLMFNGNMKYLIEFCDLMIEARLDITWSANMIIRPEMAYEVIKKIKSSGCEHIIFGIESGSEKVLNLMKKHYKIRDADRIIKDMHEMGIVVTGNFMFGFPGETEEDFKETLNFINRNAKYLDRAYPSRTYCAIEEFSYLADNLEEFGVKPNPPNHLFWESVDGSNTYPLRLDRCRRFSEKAFSFGIEIGCGVQTSVRLDEIFNLYQYYDIKKDYNKALGYLLEYFDLESSNELVTNKLKEYFIRINSQGIINEYDEELLFKLTMAVYAIRFKAEKESKIEFARWVISRERSLALLKAIQHRNSKLNDSEIDDTKSILNSSPKIFVFQMHDYCNLEPSMHIDENYTGAFNLESYRECFENRISAELTKAEKIIFNGRGDLLSLPNSEEILDYFDEYFPHVVKIFNISILSLNSGVFSKITNGKSIYILNLFLYASNPFLHKAITGMNNFDQTIINIRKLVNSRKYKGKPWLSLIFVANAFNIEDLPNFIILASELGIDKVICYYRHVHMPNQKHLSCFFKQNLTNKMLYEAEALANKLNIEIELPPRFALKEYPDPGICREPFSQIMFDSQGHVLPCDASEDCNEILCGGKNFTDIWNGPYYQKLRRSLIEGNRSCFEHCLRANPASVNDFKSHVICRGGRKDEDVNVLWGDNLQYDKK